MKLVVAVFLFCFLHSAFGFGSGISSTVFSLPAYQTENGGFQSLKFDGVPSNVEETEHALFLASLFGVKGQIDSNAVHAYLDSLLTSDGGYSHTPGQSSELESVRNALFTYVHLGQLPHHHTETVEYINSLYESSTGLFRPSPGGTPDFKATATALEIFYLIGHNNPDVAEKKNSILAKLKSSVKHEDGKSFFSTITTDNYFAIFAGHLAGFEFEEPASWIKYFTQRQVQAGAKKGGFYADSYEKDVGVADLRYAVRAIYLLKGKKLVNKNDINLQSLSGYLSTLPRGLAVASHAYATLASTTIFQETFKIAPTYFVKDSRFKVSPKRIIQGTQFKPSLQVRTTYGLVHPTLSASVVIRYSGEDTTIALTYNPETQHYETDQYYDSKDKFGKVILVYKLQWEVVSLETIYFTVSEHRSIGYDTSISSSATYGDNSVSEGGIIGFGTTFSFDVKLGTTTVPKPKLLDGEFILSLTVLDSSNVQIDRFDLDGENNHKPFRFDYTLSSFNIPAGRVTFRFEISNEIGVHTTEEVWYNLQVRMAATSIQVPDEREIFFGQTLTITMEPATLPDLNTVEAYQPTARQFYLDLYTESQVHLATYTGKLEENSEPAKYSFSINISPRFDIVGEHIVSFRYKDAYGQDIKLQNFDSESKQLLDDDYLKIAIKADLEIQELQGAPTSNKLTYGEKFQLTFKLVDAVSKAAVFRASNEASVLLVLRHKEQDGSSYISTQARAIAEFDKTGTPTHLVINWAVDPNAVKGSGELHLIVKGVDGKETALLEDGEPWVFPVDIGGNVSPVVNSYSDDFDDYDATFLIPFELSCEGQQLSNAQLSARVSYANKPKNTLIDVLPVAAGLDGNYQVSWTLPTEKAKSGEYIVEIFRQVDLQRATTPDPFESTSPFFVVNHNHQGKVISPLPFKTEFLVLLVLLVSLVAVSMKKIEIEKANK